MFDLYSSKTYLHDIERSASQVIGADALRGSSVLVAGASGLIGSFIVDVLNYLSSTGMNITVYASGRSRERLKTRFDGCPYNGDLLELVELDVCDARTPVQQTDYVIHAASNAFPAVFRTDPVGTIEANVSGTFNMLRLGTAIGARRMLYVSSGEVYGQGDVSLDAFDENYAGRGFVDPISVRSCYPMSKRMAETACVCYTEQYGLDTVITRPCHTFGPNATGADNRANVQFVNEALAGKPIELHSEGSQLRSYCYVADAASAILSVMLVGETGMAYNVANPDACATIAQFAQTVAKVAGTEVKMVIPDQDAVSERSPIVKQVLSVGLLEGLGWRGSYTVEEGIAHTVAALQEARQDR